MTASVQTVFITGAAGHLGRAVAEAFAGRGANLVLAGRAASLANAYGSSDATRLLVPADLSDQRQLDSAVAAGVERFGGIDVLCNIAGGFRMGDPVHATRDEDWDYLFDINLRTMLHAVRAVVPAMLARGAGKIVNIGAGAALRASARAGVYAASKAGVVRLTEAMAMELRDRGINVNCVLPATLDTPDNRAAMPTADPGRFVALRDLANVVVFLASEDARALNGVALPVTGLS